MDFFQTSVWYTGYIRVLYQHVREGYEIRKPNRFRPVPERKKESIMRSRSNFDAKLIYVY